MTFPQLSDDAGAVYERFSIPAQPAFVFVNDTGDIETHLGAVDEETLDTALADLAG